MTVNKEFIVCMGIVEAVWRSAEGGVGASPPVTDFMLRLGAISLTG